tara:strand:- start:2722 stop:3453 length:732 start_codon:yes stop_codon:yes gene_type:complete
MKAISICIGRKGSKGLPGKNTLKVMDHPMAYYPMQAAQKSKYINLRYLSTDDEQIADIGKKLNHQLITRPAELATSKALGEDVFYHTYMEILSKTPEIKNYPIVLLFCNAPTISAKLIDEAIEILNDDENADSVVTVSKFNMYSPLRARKINPDNNFLQPFVPFETFGDPRTLNCDRDSQGDVLFANMSLSVVRPKCLLNMSQGLLPQKWMGKNIKPIFQEFGCDVDYSWQVPLVEEWIKHNF